MIVLLAIPVYFLIGFLFGIIICKIKGKEWCRSNEFVIEYDLGGLIDNNAQCAIYISTLFWAIIVLCAVVFGPFFILHYIIEYTSKKLQK